MGKAEDFILKHSEMDADYLEHHGILGMKWGVQNGPPYPLSDADHNASERKAGWRQSLAKAGNTVKQVAKNIDDDIKAKKAAKEKEEEEKAKAAAKAEKAAKKKEHDEAIKKADVDYIEEHKTEFTDAEILSAIERKSLVNKLRDLDGKLTSEDVQTAIRKGDIQYAFANRDLFTKEELEQVMARYQTNTKLDSMANPRTPSKMEKFKKLGDTAGDLGTTLEKGTKLYNAIARITNAMGLTELPIVSDKLPEGKKTTEDNKPKDSDKAADDNKPKDSGKAADSNKPKASTSNAGAKTKEPDKITDKNSKDSSSDESTSKEPEYTQTVDDKPARESKTTSSKRVYTDDDAVKAFYEEVISNTTNSDALKLIKALADTPASQITKNDSYLLEDKSSSSTALAIIDPDDKKFKHSDLTDEFLAHHGILGMKWGVQNGPPYPLDDEDHSAREKAMAKKGGGGSGKDTKKKETESEDKVEKKVSKAEEFINSKKKDLSKLLDRKLYGEKENPKDIEETPKDNKEDSSENDKIEKIYDDMMGDSEWPNYENIERGVKALSEKEKKELGQLTYDTYKKALSEYKPSVDQDTIDRLIRIGEFYNNLGPEDDDTTSAEDFNFMNEYFGKLQQSYDWYNTVGFDKVGKATALNHFITTDPKHYDKQLDTPYSITEDDMFNVVFMGCGLPTDNERLKKALRYQVIWD